MQDVNVIYGEVLIWVFFFEVFLVLIFLAVLLLRRVYNTKWADEKRAMQSDLSEQLVTCILNEIPFESSKRKWKFKELSLFLLVVENFDHRFKGGFWEKLKEEIATKYFLDKARRFSRKRSWVKRNFAARVFALYPLEKDMQKVLTLIDDKVFLVRSAACRAAIEAESKEGIFKVIEHMSREEGYPYIYYRDLFVQQSQKVYQWVEERALDIDNKTQHLACLDILSNVSVDLNILPLAVEYHESGPHTRLGIVKIYAHNPQHNSQEILLEALQDNEPNIRAEAALGLQNFASEESFEALRNALHDDEMDVRLRAAVALRGMGFDGEAVLKSQKPEENLRAYEAAQYALKFS